MLSVVASLVLAPAAPVNLITNGNFELGRKWFSTQYAFSQDVQKEGTYVVGTDPKAHHPGAHSFGDHTTGRGQMLIVNGGSYAADAIWQSTLKVAPDTTYEFSGWTTSWSMNPDDGTASDPTPGRFQMYVDGQRIGAVHKVESKSGVWNKFVVSWKSSADKPYVVLKIVNTNTSEIGNDFSIDDLIFKVKEKSD